MTTTEIAERQPTDPLDIPDVLNRNAAPQVAQPPAVITPMQLLQIAAENNADLDKLTKLMDLQERWEANEARKAFVVALTAFKQDPPTVVKNRKAGYESKRGGARTDYEYATVAQVVAAIAPALAQHGLSHSWSTNQPESGGIAVTCVLTHQMGHSENVSMRAPSDDSGSKNAIQAIASTLSYLERYTLLAICGLAPIDQEDDDGAGIITMITDEQKDELVALLKEVNADSAKFLDYFKVAYIEQLPDSEFDRAKRALVAKRKKAPENKKVEG